jgi:hypothetical protein
MRRYSNQALLLQGSLPATPWALLVPAQSDAVGADVKIPVR